MFGTRSRNNMPWLSFGRKLDKLDNEFRRMFSASPSLADAQFPAFNIYANDEGAVMMAELPGVAMEDVELVVSGNRVSVKGKRREAASENATRIRRERQKGEFSRAYELPFNIEASKVEAKSNKGVLRIELPRAETDKPRRIEVKTA